MVSACWLEILEWRQKYHSSFYGFSGSSFCYQLSLSSAVRLRAALLLYYLLSPFPWYDLDCCLSRKPMDFVTDILSLHAVFLDWIVRCMVEVFRNMASKYTITFSFIIENFVCLLKIVHFSVKLEQCFKNIAFMTGPYWLHLGYVLYVLHTTFYRWNSDHM